MLYHKIQQWSDRAAVACAIALGASILISTALDSVLVVLLLLFWLAGNVPAKMHVIRRSPAAMASLGLYLLLVLGCTYGDASLGLKLSFLAKYKSLLFFPLLLPLFVDARARKNGFIGFTTVIVVTLLLSALRKTGWMPILDHWFPSDPQVGAVVFRGHIAQSYIMAVAAFIYGVCATQVTGRKRFFLGLLALACIDNILFMIYGRTGYVVLAVLVVYFVATLRQSGGRGMVTGIVVLGLLVGSTAVLSHRLDHRVEAAVHDAEQWSPTKADHTSNGMRLEFYRNTLLLIPKHPLIGVGTGGFANAYQQQVAGTGMIATHNPHQEMLLITAQLGAIGLIGLLFFYFQYWRQAGAIPDPAMQWIARGVLLSFIAGGLMNSLLINHVESLFFAWWSAWVFGYCYAQHQEKREQEKSFPAVAKGLPVDQPSLMQ